jgi:hypothetical protein
VAGLLVCIAGSASASKDWTSTTYLPTTGEPCNNRPRRELVCATG